MIYNNFNKTRYCINCSNHKNESECPCYKEFKATHEYPHTSYDERIKYHKELQELIKNCPRSNENFNHAIIKKTQKILNQLFLLLKQH